VSDPVVSVVLPFRDAAETLGAALDSIRRQSLAQFECLLVDDGSRDTSSRVAADCAATDARFRLLRAGGGLVEALTRGIGAARAPFIARMDADDLAHPERLARQCELLERDDSLSAVGCLVDCFPAGGAGAGMQRYVDWLNTVVSPQAIRNAIFIESPIAHPSAVLRREALAAVGGYRDHDGPEDYDLWLRLVVRGHRLAKVPQTLLRWRDSPGRLSRVDRRYARRRFFATKVEHFPRAVPPATPLQIWGAGPTGRAWARALRPLGYRIEHFIDIAPQRWGRQVAGVVVERPRAPERRNGFILIAVGAPGARDWIAAWLAQHDLQPWRDYLAVA
jgi:glycosyltransferase involved in cell wall biosynthesis